MIKQTAEERAEEREADRLEEAEWKRSQERQTRYREFSRLLSVFLLALAIVLAGKSVGEGIAAQGERSVQRNYECTVEFQKNQLERLFRSPTEKE